MKQRETASRRRAGFTVIEILVVVAIIAILVGTLLVAFNPAVGGQKGRITKALLKKLDGEIAYQWGEASKDFGKKIVPAEIQTVFGPCPEPTAKVIWLKLQLKAAFPMTYAEALDPAGGNTTLQAVLKPKAIFVRNIKSGAAKPGESAACLLLALQQNFGGKKFDAEAALGPAALQDSDKDGLMEIVDTWGNPVFFFRWGTGNAALDALARGSVSNFDRDLEDPEHGLTNAAWNPDGGTIPIGVQRYQALCHRVRDSAGTARRSFFTVPTVVSAGKDGKIGLNFDMSSTGADETDNIYSFLVR